MRTPHPAVEGHVERWDPQEGVGVLRAPDGLDVFCHYSQVQPEAGDLPVGARVYFDYETPGQDGCSARVLTSARAVE
jgi:cold shock CspA family protein